MCRRLEQEPAAAQSANAHRVIALGLDLDAQLDKRLHVRVEAAAADHVTARRRDLDRARARQQRPGEQEGGADAPAEIGIEIGLDDLAGVNGHVVRAPPLGRGAGEGEQLDHRLDVADARDVVQRHRLGAEQGGSQYR